MGRLLILSSVRPGQGITEIDTVYSCVIYINKSFQTQAHIHISELTVLLDFPFFLGGGGKKGRGFWKWEFVAWLNSFKFMYQYLIMCMFYKDT